MADGKERFGGSGDEKDTNEGKEEEKQVLEDENVYEVEKIVGMMTNDQGKVMYRVRWLNYSPQSDTWEPFDNLLTCQDLVEEYVSKERKKKKMPSEKILKKKKKSSKRKSEFDDDDDDDDDDESPTETRTKDTTGDANEPQKNKFWKDLEAGNINLFDDGDMYSKVKERSSSRQQMEKRKKPTTDASEATTSSGLTAKPRHRICSIVSDSSDDERDKKVSKAAHEQPPPRAAAATPGAPKPKKSLQMSDALVNRILLSQANEMEEAEKRREAHKKKKCSNLLKSSAQTHSTTKKVHEKIQNHENMEPVKRVPTENSNNNGGATRSAGSRVDPNEIRFEFRHYNPEEWVPKEACNSSQIVDMTNVQFREAVKEGDYERLRGALNSKTPYNLEQCDASGTTLLMIAAMSGYDDIAELLVMRGANINAAQKHGGATALMMAAEKGHTCVVAILLGLGAHMDAQLMSGETALMKACRKGHRQIVQLLLECGANYAATNNSSLTAVEVAKMYDWVGIEGLLRDHSAKVLAAFEEEVFVTLNNTAKVLDNPFPIHCFALNESTQFKINFHYQLAPCQSGVGMLLFIAHARITAQEMKCRFYGPCAVINAILNGVEQRPLTEGSNFVFSFCPLQNGRNELIINTVSAITAKAKLIVCAYRAQLTMQS